MGLIYIRLGIFVSRTGRKLGISGLDGQAGYLRRTDLGNRHRRRGRA